MQNNSISTFIDFFKLFKVFELKKIEKTGVVKIVQDKELGRKIVSVQGNISTSNYITFQTNNFPNIPFSERYLYIQAFLDNGKSFCFQVAYSLGSKTFKAVYSTLYKSAKKHLENIVHLPFNLPAGKWTIAVVDLYQLGLHFGFKPQEMKMIFKATSIEIRASSKVKGMFQSDYLFSIDKMPKDICFPLKKQETFFQKYHYFVETTDPACLKYASQFKEVISQQIENKHSINMKEHKRESKEKNKQAKSVEDQRQLSTSKSRRSLEKEKADGKIINKQAKTANNNARKSQNNPLLPPVSGRKKQQKSVQLKPLQKQQQIEENQLQAELIAPVPQAMISLSLSCVEGFSLNCGNLMAIQSYLYKPIYMPVHKPIQLLASCDDHNMRVVTGYIDGSICIWDAIRKAPLGYFMTELTQLKTIISDMTLNLILVGLDKMKRQVINIISEGSVIFRQISNFNINGTLLVSRQSFTYGILTYGFQNIRLWRINNQKSIIQGSNIYLGQSNRKVKYTSAIIIHTRDDFIVYVTDNNGFITTISVTQGKMLQSLKIDSCCIDQILLLNDGRAMISNETGTIRIINLQRMEVLQEYCLNNRIKDMKQLPSQEIILTHYNKSIGSLNLQTSMYSFLMRSHTSSIAKIIYNVHLNKVASISKDNSIRIWQYVVDHQGQFQFRLQEQYEFMITGEEMVDIACGVQGKLEDLTKVIVGGDSGKLRIINIQKYQIQQEVIIQNGPMSISISRNGRYVLCTYASGNSYLLDSNLNIIFKYLRTENQKKKMKLWKNGFNRINKQYYIENVQEEKLQFYALKDPSIPIFGIKFIEKALASISFIGNKVYILSENELKLFDKGVMMQIVNLNSPLTKLTSDRCIAFQFPLICMSIGQKLVLKVATSQLEEEVQLPQPLSSITIHYSSQKQDGLIICSGKNSFSLYVFAYQLHNITETILSQKMAIEKYEQKEGEENSQLQISFSNKTTVSGYVNKKEGEAQKNFQKKTQNSKLLQAPKQLKSLYAHQQALYQQVKQFLFPKSFQQPINQQPQHEDQAQHEQEQQPSSNQLGILLNYGYQLRQNSKDENDIGNFFWLADNNSLIMLTGCNKSIMQHFFSVPIKHKVINFPSAVTSICLSQRPYESHRYLTVCINGLIKLYNVFEEISFIRNIDTISTTFIGSVIFQSCITNCNRYILTLSYNGINFDSKLYIHVIELSSGSVVSSSYLSLPASKNKYKTPQAKQAREYRMMVNPWKTSLQFVLFNPQGFLYFYRITSIFTLQTMQLQQLLALCRDKISAISCGCFIRVGDASFEDAVFAIGTQNGSLVFIDCRTANIMIACVNVTPTPIFSISYSKQHDEQSEKLILFGNSTLITVFNLTQGLNSILTSMEQANKSAISTNSTSEAKRGMTLDGEVTAKSNIESNGQQILITKTGTLWLIDYEDFVTVKVSSVHTLPINQAEMLVGDNKEAFMLTCSDDGTAKLSNLVNLQQVLQIYKPRKQARSFSTTGNFTLISFSDEVYIYNKINPNTIQQQCQLSSLGSFRLDAPIIWIQNIPSTQNYYIMTQNQLLIVYVALKQPKNKNRSELSLKTNSCLSGQLKASLLKEVEVNVQIKKITDIQHPFKLVVNAQHSPYDQFALICRPGKVTIWSRKCLKRSYNPIDQLSNVHDLSYYLIDSHSVSTVDTSYVRFLSQAQYLWGLYQEGLVQVRNFKEHAVMREINMSVERLSAMISVGQEQMLFYVGDQNGYLYVINENGLLIDKIKTLQCKISGISLWNAGTSQRLLVYGSKYAVTLKTIDLR